MIGSTYRLQLQPSFGFDAARGALPYLDRLGVTTVYTSPVTRSRSGSTHGYDVVDPGEADPELGGRERLDAMIAAIHERDMSVVVDIVPNHMATGHENEWLMDVYRHGPRSSHARVFDIDWSRGALMVPVLGAPLDEALDDISIEDGHVVYFEHRLPLRPDTKRSKSVRRILEQQHYRLCHWREAQRGLNYRRFFDISELISVRQEEPGVFERTHALVTRLGADGVRVDHVDGLWDPLGYLRRLDRAARGAPIYVEKILSEDEHLAPEWPVAGTTGYEFMRAVGDVTIDADGWRELVRITAAFTGDDRPFSDVVYESKRRVVRELFGGEVDALARALATEHAGVALGDLAEAVAVVAACFGVYRTYVRDRGRIRDDDRRVIERALDGAERRGASGAGFDAVARTLRRPERARGWVMRFQQLTGPVAAKGFEDTALYRWMPLLSRNEVGGDPGTPPGGVRAFHRFCRARLRETPDALNASSTHDTKRGEDVRARLDVLSEIPREWSQHLERWRDLAHRHKTRGMPDAVDELLVYQTLLGAWPIERTRIESYLVKAAREAKRHSTWLDPDEGYERALTRFATRLLRDEAFLRSFEPLAERVARHGALNSLTSVVLKVTAPGVPDFYQGTELWWHRLVDPDNRSPLDAAERMRLLEDVERATPRALVREWRDGRIKMFVTQRALRFRREQPELFARGSYQPLQVTGWRAANVLAFARKRRNRWAIIVVPRLTTQLGTAFVSRAAWRDTAVTLPVGSPLAWEDVFTDARVEASHGALPVAAVLGTFPVALLRSPAAA